MRRQKRLPDAYASVICSSCHGTGTRVQPTASAYRNADGDTLGETRDVVLTCRECNGYGEYDVLGEDER